MYEVYKPLNSLLSTRAKVGALRVLSRTMAELTGREVARLARVSAPQIINALGELAQKGVVVRRQAGRAGMYSLNRRFLLVRRGILPLFQAEKTLLEDGIGRITKAIGALSPVSITMFGSRARGDAHGESDVDLLVVLHNKTSLSTEKIQAQTQKVSGETGIRFSSLVMSERECRKARGPKKRLLQNVLSDGRTLTGKTLKEIIHG